jgi:RNA-binding motif protein, X-linked 2
VRLVREKRTVFCRNIDKSMNTIRDVIQINEQELLRGIAGTSASWHSKYSQSAWVYVGNLDHSLTEGDIICVLSQYGEIDDIHLVRDEVTGVSRGFAFCKYSDARSSVLAVDNFCGIQVCSYSRLIMDLMFI